MTHQSLKNTIFLLPCFCLTWTATALYAADEPARFGYPEALTAAIHQVEPVYPEKARRLKIESNVAIDAYVETDGSVYSTIIVWGDPKLVDAAENAAKEWKFKPFMENGHPIRAIARLLFEMKPPSSNRASR
jgi:TonB family protein